MKTRLATGIFLAAALFSGRLSAQQYEQLQWLPATSISPRNNVQQRTSAEPIGVMLGDAVLLNQTSFTSMDDGPVPRPLPSTNQVPMTAQPQTEAPLIVPVPQSGQQPSFIDEAIPVGPTQIIENGHVVSSRSCNCGGGTSFVGGAVVVDDGGSCCGGCGACCVSCGTCGDCCASPGWLGWLDWLRPSSWHDCGCQTSCLDGCCMDGCCYDGNRTRFWVTGEYLLFQFSKPNLPALVTSGGVGPVINGVNTGPALGQNGTTILVGNDSFDQTRSGMRFGAGLWFPAFDSKLGLDFSVMYFPQVSQTITENSGVLGRPFFNVTPATAGSPTTNYPTTETVNGFNGTTGSVSVDYWNRVWGFDANLRYKLCCSPNFRIDLLAGYRNFNLQEGLSVNENLNFGGGITNQITDAYNANNAFNGGQIGVDAEWRFFPRWSVGGCLKLALGDVHESVNISGSTVPFAGAPAPIGVGFFAANTNIGNYSRDQFAVLPEATVKIGFDITRNVRIFVAYDVLYLSNAVRVGDTIDTTINTNNNQLFGAPGNPLRPAYNFSSSNFLAQGFTGGLDIHW